MRLILGIAASALLLAPAAALAHHSYAMFDQTKTVALDGSIVKFKWQNPHAFIEIDVSVEGEEEAKVERWVIEMTSPNNLAVQGWKRSSLKPGEAVTLRTNPLRNGSKGGSFVGVKKADGSTLGNWEG